MTSAQKFELLDNKKSRGMTAQEWNLWTSLFRNLNPDGYKAYLLDVRHQSALKSARENLSFNDLKMLLDEKQC